MLELVDSRDEKVAAQAEFNRLLQRAWRTPEERRIVWRPDGLNTTIHQNGAHWFTSVTPGRDQSTPRYWNSFGKYRRNGNLTITVEINIPIASNERTVSGFFARDPQSGMMYLLHDGAVGGGRKGVGKASFLAWTSSELTPVRDARGDVRLGIIVSPLVAHQIGKRVAAFVERVAAFKEAVSKGAISDEFARQAEKSFRDYYREFSGTKKRARLEALEYVSRHGDIVEALREWRTGHAANGERVVKNAYIDLGIANGSGPLRELYEVKTGIDRQALYTGIGQLLVHGAGDKTRRYLVLPEGPLPAEIASQLKALEIGLLRFKLTPSAAWILGTPAKP